MKSLDALVARVDEDRWLSSRYAPKAEREALVALYAFNYELARIRLAVSEPGLGAIRFQWWREALDGLDDPVIAGRHAVTGALAPLVAGGRLGAGGLHDLLDRHQDAYDAGARAREPEDRLARLSAGVLDADWDRDGAYAGPLDAAALEYAAARRGEAETEAGATERLKVTASIRPAVAHLALRRAYRAGKTPSPLGRRWRILRAMVTGTI